MPFTMPNYPMLTYEQLNPLMTGMEHGANLGQTFANVLAKQLENQKAQQLMPFNVPNAEADLLAKKIANEWNPRLHQSTIGYQGAQAGLSRAETEKLRQLMPTFAKQAQADIAKAELLNQFLSGAFKGMPGQTGQQVQQPGQMSNQPNLMTNGQQQPSTTQTQIPGANQALLASQLLGFGKPQIIDVNGTQVAVTPFGNVPIAQGLTEFEKGKAQELGKVSGKFYEENVNQARALQNQGVALDQLIHLVNTNPEFRNVTGPIESVWKKWTGTKEQKELLGSLQSASGEIMLQVAPSIKGAFTGRDQAMVNEVKANPKTDFADSFIGKLKSQKLIEELLSKRHQLTAEYIEQGLTPTKALKRATEETQLDQLRPVIDKLINPVVNLVFKNGKLVEKK